MDWTITEVEKNGDYITLTATAEIPLKELQAVLEGTPITTSSKVVKKPKAKKALVKKKPAPATGKTLAEKAAYARERYAKRKTGNAPTLELTGEDPSEDKIRRMEKLQESIKKLEEEDYANPERP